MTITYLGHSCFEIKTNNSKILVDPFLVMSPKYDTNSISDLFVTHGHGDHLGSAIEISKKTGTRCTKHSVPVFYLPCKIVFEPFPTEIPDSVKNCSE